MKYNKIPLILAIIGMSFTTMAQKNNNNNPKHINCFGEVTKETKDVKVEASDVVAMMAFAKFKMKLTNKTADYILFKPKETVFQFDSGELNPEDKKQVIIQPLDKLSKVIDVKGGGNNLHVDVYKYNLGGLYRIPANSPVVAAPNFALPPSLNEIVVGNFKIELTNSLQETGQAAAKFKITYLGEGMGLVEPKKLGIRILSVKGKKFEDDKVFANNAKTDGFLLGKGESETFTAIFRIEGQIADLQFANTEIVWGDTFKDCEMIKIEDMLFNFVLDPGLTAGKNK